MDKAMDMDDTTVAAAVGADAGVSARTPTDTGGHLMDRRSLVEHLLTIGAAGLATALGTGAGLAMAAEPAAAAAGASTTGAKTRRKFRYGMVIDTRRCVGCRACVVACKAENKTPPGVSYTVVVEEALGERSDDKPLFMTKPCFHCEHPPCVDVCPVSATFKREQDGIVVIDYDRCIGCRYCITACPYGARYFDFGENNPAVADHTPYAQVPSPEYRQFRLRQAERSPIGNVRKCTFCLHLQDAEGRYDKAAGRWPACAKTCTGHAIFFGDFNDPESEVSRLVRERNTVRLKEDLGTEPNVRYLL
jgi:molybdopterin-containing oxidoreductase family iron-sulfur binding subunit